MHYFIYEFKVREAGHIFNLIKEFEDNEDLDFNVAEFQHECFQETSIIFLDKKIVGECWK